MMTKAKTEHPQRAGASGDPGERASTDEWGWEAHRIAQLRAALRMTQAERLAWLERTNASMRALVGLARRRPHQDPAQE